jgi:hypothetical protein
MTSVIMPPSSTMVDVDKFLTVLSDPQAARDHITQLKRASDEATAAQEKIRLGQVKLDLDRKTLEEAMLARENKLIAQQVAVEDQRSSTAQRESALKALESQIQDRDVSVSARERDVIAVEQAHKSRAHSLDTREQEVADREHVVEKLRADVLRLKTDYEERLSRFKALAN